MKGSTHKKKATDLHEAEGLAPLIAEVRRLIQSARHAAATTVNTLQVLTNYEIGRLIVEHEQKGAKRAEYGKELLKDLSSRLTEEFGKGFSLTNLKLMRQFFVEHQNRIGQSLTDQFPLLQISQKASDQSQISQKPSEELAISAKVSRKSPFTLSWSHYVLLLTINNPDERSTSMPVNTASTCRLRKPCGRS